ncbi:tellurium resistance protein [Neotabrizicola sp. sgz301269]|uniref:SLAC1 family transporter n=1 Tax=Neotabrizicola sp. sgz301269 TaxID=3276282 RepID=UPI00376F572C
MAPSPAPEPIRRRPPTYPPPEFPPRRLPVFARVPPAIFPVLLGLLGLAGAMRLGFERLGLPLAAADLVAGLVLGLWAFGIFGYLVKLCRRPGVILEDMRVMPGRAALAAGTGSVMTAAVVLGPFAPGAALALLWTGLVLHFLLAVLAVAVLADLPREARGVNPGWHILFTGFILGAPPAALLGQEALARGLIWATIPVALAIWGASLAQLLRGAPPAPLRPMLAIHLAPACLFATAAALTGQVHLEAGFATMAIVIALALASAARWICAAGITPLWGAFSFPIAALATALLRQTGGLASLGMGVLGVALIAVPWIAWLVLKDWPSGRLAAKTNAATA